MSPYRSLTLSVLFGLGASIASPAPQPHIIVVNGSDPRGFATAQWLTMLQSRLSPGEYDSVKVLRHTRTVAEESWASLIESEATVWPARTAIVRAAFDSIQIDTVTIVIGDRGADDAFATDSETIGFDVSALQRAYGDVAAAGNRDRLDRIFLHEFSHLLQKRTPAAHAFIVRAPIDEAIRREWIEGLGNYYSLSADWLPDSGGPSALARQTLADLQPVFVSRMTALACARGTDADSLMRGLSSGPFARKWGALPVALWLADEVRIRPNALRAFNRAGPNVIWTLAERHLPPPLADSLHEARTRAKSC